MNKETNNCESINLIELFKNEEENTNDETISSELTSIVCEIVEKRVKKFKAKNIIPGHEAKYYKAKAQLYASMEKITTEISTIEKHLKVMEENVTLPKDE